MEEEQDPFGLINEGQLGLTLQYLHIKQSVWDSITQTYPKIYEIFHPSFVDDVDGEYFAVVTNQFFDFKNANTISSRKIIFKKWLKEYWNIFKARTFKACCENIYMTLIQHNQDNPSAMVPCINWIPSFGGLISLAVKEVNEIKFKEMKKITYPLKHAALEDDPHEDAILKDFYMDLGIIQEPTTQTAPGDQVSEEILNTRPGIPKIALMGIKRPMTPIETAVKITRH
jgi:hypothetical protein